ncbi:type I methionyl aminopeptidase [Brevibacterium jeotgali]|uniref:Methionine aminopeptidase n=1 Tax=Brevibacterium jeotgali TaxID=1262550 RepID=A0A2H1L0N1_9MICO|nr:type I methionyl aminopeptidase [Brevibacterium jeotgali]TWC02193.1 methionine aminopeptidase type I [Brevibacterium jeotgali]SMY10457.1 methionyl aminopeptidase [Brevibacterium jeotgali]
MFDSVELKSDQQIRTMRRAGLVTRAALEAARAACVPGATTGDVNAAGAKVIADRGATSNFKGYHGFPAALCVSVNEVVVHGIPGERVLAAGDMVSIDGGAIVEGLHGDSAMTVFVGGEEAADPAHVRLSQTTEEIMWAGIAAMATGKRVGEIGAAIEERAQELAPDLGLIEDFTGHGIGSQMHMEPEVLNYRAKRMGPKLKPGMCLAIEPMLVGGDIATKTLDDDWTVVTVDGARASHWEHSVARHAGGVWVLTSPDGGAERLRPYGVVPVPLD